MSIHRHLPQCSTVHAAYLRCLCDCSKCDSSGFDLDSRNSSWSIARLKEYLRKKENTVVCWSRKPSFLNAEYLSSQCNGHLAYRTLRCVYTPVLFQVQPETKKKKPPGTNFACIATSSPCFLPASDSEWPQHLAQTTEGANISLSLRLRASYSHLGPMRAKSLKTPMALHLLSGSA